MTDCAHEECDCEATGSVLWESDTMRNYCDEHIEQSTELAEFVEAVDMLDPNANNRA